MRVLSNIFFKIKVACLTISLLCILPNAVSAQDLQYNHQFLSVEEPLIRISELLYGDYAFHIAGQSYLGVWSKRELLIPVYALRPAYSSWWAFILYGLVIGGILYFIRKYQIRRILENAEKLRLRKSHYLKQNCTPISRTSFALL